MGKRRNRKVSRKKPANRPSRQRPKTRSKTAPSPAIVQQIAQTFAGAIALHRQGRIADAETLYKKVLRLEPEHADALHMLGVMAHQLGQYDNAVARLAAAIASNDDIAHYHFNHGVSLQALQRNADAAAAYRRAVNLQSDYRAAWENLGVALQDQNDIDGALEAYRKAEAIDPRSAIAHLNIGALLMVCGDIQEARDHFRTLLDLMPAYGEAHLKYAVTSLACGDLAAGWRHYEWRVHAESYAAQNAARTVPFPTWDGHALDDGALLITAEQGIGDELMFASCFADAAELVSRLVIECDQRLVPIFGRSFPDATVLSRSGRDSFAWDSGQAAIDYKIAAGSLPRLLRSKPGDFPQKPACLSVASERQSYWRERLSDSKATLNIGVSWRGGRDARAERARSLPLEDWQTIFTAADARFVNLQYGDHADEIEAFNATSSVKLETLEGIDPLQDVDDFMALISVLDLVISVDNSTVFMANAVGTPAWVMLPVSADWRWFRDLSTSPWCPSAELFRQKHRGEWQDVVAAMAERVSDYAR